ncbi:hypothetical protein Tco_0599398 [Tanacetum coccineum]
MRRCQLSIVRSMIAKDYEERVWVKETIVFSESWVDLDGPFPSDCVNVDEIAFAPIRVSRNLIRVPIYDVKTRSFKSVKYFLGEHFLRAKTTKAGLCRTKGLGRIPVGVGNGIGDKWRWTLNGDGDFSVKDLSRLVEEKILDVERGGQETIWNKLVPKKVYHFGGEVLKGRIPFVRSSIKEALIVDSVLCPCVIVW